MANCASCHGVHNILPSSDPKSTINPKNLPATCGKCHPGAGTRFAISQVHLTPDSAGEPPALRWVRQFYLLLIPVTIGLMFLHNGGDWVRKLIRLRGRARLGLTMAGRSLRRHKLQLGEAFVGLFLWKNIRRHVGGAGRVFFAQRVPLPPRRHENAGKAGMIVELHAEHVVRFALVPICRWPGAGNALDRWRLPA